MALLVRTTDHTDFVHASDPDAKRDLAPKGWPADRDWLPALGQPDGATRVRVRALSMGERAQAQAVWADIDMSAGAAVVEAAADETTRLHWLAVQSIGGEAIDPADVDVGLRVAIVQLVAAVSSGVYGPLGR